MATYTTLNQDALEKILAHYAIGTLQRFDPLEGGKANSSVILVTSTGKYVLSVCDEKSSDEIRSLTSTLEYLGKHNFPTTRIVRTQGGKPFIDHGSKPIYLKKFIEGTVQQSLTPSMAYQIGVFLARLHAIPPHPDLPDTFAYGIESYAEITDSNEPGKYPQWLRSRVDYLRQGCLAELPKGFIHGDLFYDNMLFSNNKIVAILDFEEACNYLLIFDLGMCAAGCCTSGTHFLLDSTAALIAGYQSMRTLVEKERQLLQLHIEYGAVATSFWRYRQYNIRYPGTGQSEAYRGMTSIAQQVRDIPKDTFLNKIFT